VVDAPDSLKQEPTDEVAQEVASLIPAKEVPQPEVRAWKLSNLEFEAIHKEASTEQAVYDEIKQKMQPEINRQTEVLKKEAYELAKQEGFDAGYAEGKVLGEQEAKEIALAEAQTALENKIQTMDSLLKSFNAPYEFLEQKVFENLADLALNMAEEVIQKEISQLSSEWVVKIVNESISALNDTSQPIEIFLHPEDLSLIQTHAAAFSENWNFQPSEDVTAGTCQIKQGFSSVEHDWKNRFASMSVKLQAQALGSNTEEKTAD